MSLEIFRALQLPPGVFPAAAPPQFLYRGQSNAEWLLDTTLERADMPGRSLTDYYDVISGIKPQIETFTTTTWTTPTPPDYRKWLEQNDSLVPYGLPAYDYMVYLRHHGFPSPLLDWSRSLYVATYFAFRERPASDRVAIFAFVERPIGIKGYSSGSPSIWGMGPHVKAHRRHFLQQAEYTICLIKDDEWRYASHESSFGRNREDQDLLWKFCLPSAIRPRVLQSLEAYNLNAFSLFGSEESLVETLAARAFIRPAEAGIR